MAPGEAYLRYMCHGSAAGQAPPFLLPALFLFAHKFAA